MLPSWSRPAIALIITLSLQPAAYASVFRTQFNNDSSYLLIEVLDDDLIHFEASAIDPNLSISEPIYTSPMVFKTDYAGPSVLSRQENSIETRDIRLEVNPGNLCVRLYDKTREQAYLTTLCPKDLNRPLKGLAIAPGPMEHVYGLGQDFQKLGATDGDWTALGIREGLEWGNGFQFGFQDAAVGNVQIPVYYTVGPNNLNYALFMDNFYKQRWDFTASPWVARMLGDALRFYFMTGPDLPDLRADYLELTGRPPVPPRKSLGLWVSEFGYDNWAEVDALREGLRANHFPVDGFVIDLNWYGGVALDDPSQSNTGRLDWDQDQTTRLASNSYSFPDPERKIQEYAADHLRLTVIEQSYVANTTNTFTQMPPDLTAYKRTEGVCNPEVQHPVTDVEGFWGIGRMIDWSDPAAGRWIHNQRRFPNLVQKGINHHWTDLGEPESFDSKACYEGFETPTGFKNEHRDIHNLYNLLWSRSIWQSYLNKRGQTDVLGTTNPRPFILSRSGTAGTQRYGVALWSGDIASNFQSLLTHFNTQMHMSFSGIDYYGADIGGFRREVLPYNDKRGSYRGYEDELYTQWFANGAWLDTPVRPHVDNEFVKASPPYATAPHLVGKLDSNLANLRQRYELIPYYYSLAYQAHLYGEPVVPPPVFYYQNDPNVRQMGDQKLIGRDLLVGVVAKHGAYERDLYLPAGTWVNYHSNEWFSSSGEVVEDIPVYRDGLFRIPAFARAGAILPLMSVDAETKDAFGHRRQDATVRDELIVRVYADGTPSSFTLYEDDGLTLTYDNKDQPRYHYRTTAIRQQQVESTVTVTIEPASDVNGDGPFPGAVMGRSNVVELIVDGARAAAIRLDDALLPEYASEATFQAAERGWYNAGPNRILAKSEPREIYTTTKTFTFDLQPATPTTSVNFVCLSRAEAATEQRALTGSKTDVYVVGSLPELGNWSPAEAIPLSPSVDYDYIFNLPENHAGPGPTTPIWTAVIDNLPPNTNFEWKCIHRSKDDPSSVQWQSGANNVHTTTASGYSGSSHGAGHFD